MKATRMIYHFFYFSCSLPPLFLHLLLSILLVCSHSLPSGVSRALRGVKDHDKLKSFPPVSSLLTIAFVLLSTPRIHAFLRQNSRKLLFSTFHSIFGGVSCTSSLYETESSSVNIENTPLYSPLSPLFVYCFL